GDGTFGARTDFVVGELPLAIAIADINLDGRLDMAIANNYSVTVSILLGNGDGTFGADHEFATTEPPVNVTIGDLNGDGRPDLATANTDASTVSVLLGHANGSFAPRTDFPTGTGPQSIAVGDLNRDGKPDLVTANWVPSNNTVSELLGAGNGTFPTHADAGAGIGPSWIAVGLLNPDGWPDLVAANTYDNTLSVYPGGSG